MPSVRCDRCDAECSAAEVRDGWCESCGKQLPAYLLRPVKEKTTAADAPDPRGEPVGPAREVFDRTVLYRTGMWAMVALMTFVVAAPPVVVLRNPPGLQKRTEAAIACVVGGAMGLLGLCVFLGQALTGRLVIDATELQYTRAPLGGLWPVPTTHHIPFDRIERYGFGVSELYADFSTVRTSTVMLRVRPGFECPPGDYRIPLDRYAKPDRILAVISRRWLHLRDTYGVDVVRDDADPALLIAVAVCVIHLAEQERAGHGD